MRGIISLTDSRASFRRLFLRFCRKVLSYKKTSNIAEFTLDSGQLLILSSVYVEGKGGTVCISNGEKEVPLCSFVEDSNEYKLNVDDFYNLYPVLYPLESDLNLFSKTIHN